MFFIPVGVVEMQWAGAAGAMHGALTSGLDYHIQHPKVLLMIQYI